MATDEQIKEFEIEQAKQSTQVTEQVQQPQPTMINEGYVQTLTESSGVYYCNGLRET